MGGRKDRQQGGYNNHNNEIQNIQETKSKVFQEKRQKTKDDFDLDLDAAFDTDSN